MIDTVEDGYVPSKEAQAIVDGFSLMDDVFMTRFFDHNHEATELLLNVILGRNDIRVRTVEIQKMEKSSLVEGRTVILDVFAEDSVGRNYYVEVQRSDPGAAPERARFLSGMLDSRMLKEGEEFTRINQSYVVELTPFYGTSI